MGELQGASIVFPLCKKKKKRCETLINGVCIFQKVLKICLEIFAEITPRLAQKQNLSNFLRIFLLSENRERKKAPVR